MKQHLAGQGKDVQHCTAVSPEIREYFQRVLDRTCTTKKQREAYRLRREEIAAQGTAYAAAGYYDLTADEEQQVQHAMHVSREEEEFRRGVEQRGGTFERGGGSGGGGSSRGGNPISRLFSRSSS